LDDCGSFFYNGFFDYWFSGLHRCLYRLCNSLFRRCIFCWCWLRCGRGFLRLVILLFAHVNR
jgi:hypothetical protein